MRAHRPVEITVGHYYSLSLQSCELVGRHILPNNVKMLKPKIFMSVQVVITSYNITMEYET